MDVNFRLHLESAATGIPINYVSISKVCNRITAFSGIFLVAVMTRKYSAGFCGGVEDYFDPKVILGIWPVKSRCLAFFNEIGA